VKFHIFSDSNYFMLVTYNCLIIFLNHDKLKNNSILFSERVMMAITYEDDFVSRAENE
jgi:hypothetical protein